MGKKSSIKVGDKFVLRSGDEVEVIEYISCFKVIIRTPDGDVRTVRSSNLKIGSVSVKGYSRCDNKSPTGYYVYLARHLGNVVYIGKGLGYRYMHCTNGRSSCYLLNKLHFSGEVVEVEIHTEGLEASAASDLEKQLIAQHRPEGNIY